MDTSDATATAATIRYGYTAYVKGQKITGTIPSVSGRTITPATYNINAINSGSYANGNIVVAGDTNLKAENIKSGVSIFGVAGTAKTTEYATLYLANNKTIAVQYALFNSTGFEILAAKSQIEKQVPIGSTLIIYDTLFSSSGYYNSILTNTYTQDGKLLNIMTILGYSTFNFN